jgi:uncharacterized protein (UPF0210 family)
MRPSTKNYRRFLFLRFTVIALTLLCLCGTAQCQQKTSSPDKAKVRTITAFINLDRTQYKTQIADAVKMLNYARTVFESRGYEVQTIRIATQPFPEYTKGLNGNQTVAFFKDLEALAVQNKFMLAIGPALLNANDDPAQVNQLLQILQNTKSIFGTVVVAGDDGVRWNAVGAAGRIMKSLSETTENGEGNFHFAAIASVQPLTPYFPAAYHTGFGHQFAVGLESANVVHAAFRNVPDLSTARQRLTDQLGAEASAVESLAMRVDRDLGWAYMGMDLSPAPMGNVSIGAAIEELTTQPFGSSGTLTAAATITAAIKNISVKQTGYNGLMLPILEDSRLSQRWSEGAVSLDALLSYSAVCGTGFDTIPLPGDVSIEKLDLIIGDMASLSVKWHKPLSARLLIARDKIAGDVTAFHDPNLVNATLQPLDHTAAKQ